MLAAGGDSYSISSAHLQYGRVYDLLTQPRIVASSKTCWARDVVGWGSHFFCKLPGDGKAVAWHQDASYWPLTPSKAVTVWLAIDDADVENACMRFIAGSHHFGHLTYPPQRRRRAQRPQPDDRGRRAVRRSGRRRAEGGRGLAALRPAAARLRGQHVPPAALRADAALLRRRRARLGWNAKGVVVSGSDPTALGQPAASSRGISFRHFAMTCGGKLAAGAPSRVAG